MPYNARYFRKRGRQLYANRKSIGADAALIAKLVRDVYYVKTILNVEHKFLDTEIDLAVTAAGIITPLCLVAQGDDNFERVGRRIKPMTLSVRGNLIQHASAVNTQVRLIIFKTKNNQAAVPTIAEVLKTSTPHSMYVLTAQQNSFTILSDRTMTLSDVLSTNQNYRLSKKLSGHVDYNGQAADESSQGRGGLYILLISDEATNTPTFDASFRVRYVDN